jgi:hypothetical protein
MDFFTQNKNWFLFLTLIFKRMVVKIVFPDNLEIETKN